MNRWTGNLAINGDDTALYSVSGYAMVPVAVFPYVGTIEACFAHGEIVLDVEIVDTSARRPVVAFSLARMNRF